MEPIPLRISHIVAAAEADYISLRDNPEVLVAGLAETLPLFQRMLAQEEKRPVGIVLPCPIFPDERDEPVTEQYIAQCKEVFRPLMQGKAAFYYVSNADSFRGLRAAVLAVTDMTGRNVVVELPAAAESRMTDGTDCLAAIGVLQRIGVSTVILRANTAEDLQDALERIAPHVRLSVGVRIPCEWIRNQVSLTNVEIAVPVQQENARELWQALCDYDGYQVVRRDHDDMILAPDGRDAHFINAVTDISDEIPCDHHLENTLLEIEDEEAAALKLVVNEEDDLYNLETDLYMLSRPVCLCAQTPELFEKALRIFHGLAIYDGTCEQDAAVVKYFSRKYGMICL